MSCKEIAIAFANWLDEEMYEAMYAGDDKVWVSYKHPGYDKLETAQRFTIEELFEIFKTTL